MASDHRERKGERDAERARIESRADMRSEITESGAETPVDIDARAGGNAVVRRVAFGLTRPAATTWSFGEEIPLSQGWGGQRHPAAKPSPPDRPVASGHVRGEG